MTTPLPQSCAQVGVPARLAAASFVPDVEHPGNETGICGSAQHGTQAPRGSSPRASQRRGALPANTIPGTHLLRIEFDSFPMVQLQTLLSHIFYAYDATRLSAPSLFDGSVSAGRVRPNSALMDGDSARALISRQLSVVLSGPTAAGHPMLETQPTVDVCRGMRLFYFNGKPPKSDSSASSSSAMLDGGSESYNNASHVITLDNRSHPLILLPPPESLPWTTQGATNELLPNIQVNCWCSRFDVELVQCPQRLDMTSCLQDRLLLVRNSSESSILIMTTGFLRDDAGRPVAFVEFPSKRNMSILPLPDSTKVAANVMQRLLRNILLSDGLLADTHAILNLTMETTKATRQVELVRCMSRRQSFAVSTTHHSPQSLKKPVS